MAFRVHQGVVELCVLALVHAGQRRLAALHGIGTQYRIFLVNHSHVLVGGQQLGDRLLRHFAIAALVVEEFHDGHIAVRIALDRDGGITEKLVTISGHRRLSFDGGLRFLPAAHFLRGLDDEVGFARPNARIGLRDRRCPG